MVFGIERNQLKSDIYLYESLKTFQSINESFTERLEAEHQFFLDVLEATNPDPTVIGSKTQAGANAKSAYNTAKSVNRAGNRARIGKSAKMQVSSNLEMLNKVRQFIKGVFEKFINTVNKLLVENTKWLDNKMRNIDKIDFTKLKVGLDPNYIKAEDLVVQAINDPMFKTLTNPNISDEQYIKSRFNIDINAEDFSVETFVKSSVFKNYVDQEGSLSNGCKNRFRYGSPVYGASKNSAYSGDALKDLVNHGYQYCINYGELAKKIKSLVSFTDKSLTTISRKINAEDKLSSQRDNINNVQNGSKSSSQPINSSGTVGPIPTKESYFYIEDALFENTILGEISGVEKILENVELGDEVGKGGSKPGQDKPKQANSDNNVSGNRQDKREMKSVVKNSTGNVLKLLKYVTQSLQIFITAALTVAEERYFQYLKIIKYATAKNNVPTPKAQVEKDNKGDIVT